MVQVSARRVTALLLAVYFFYACVAYRDAVSADLMAVWVAGIHFDAGEMGRIYPPGDAFFRMYPPEGWREMVAERHGYAGAVFPFLYAPLWAWVASFVAEVPFGTVARVATLVNAGLMCWIIWLGQRACGTFSRNDPGESAILTGAALWSVALTLIGLVASVQNQPQILVSALLVLTAARHIAGAQAGAGAALALAASIKLYPAVFVLYFVARQDWRAVTAFCLTGLALGLTSIAVAGWPLHRLFLEQVALVGNTVLVTGATLNIDTLVAQAPFWADLTPLPSFDARPVGERISGWHAMARPAAWGIYAKLAFVAVLAGCAGLFWRLRAREKLPLLWFIGLTAPLLLMPLAWVYYYLPTIALLPALLYPYGARTGYRIILVGVMVQSGFLLLGVLDFGLLPHPVVVASVLGVVGWLVAAVLMLRREAAGPVPLVT